MSTMVYNNNIKKKRRTTRKSISIGRNVGGERASGAAPCRHKINIIVSIFLVYICIVVVLSWNLAVGVVVKRNELS